MNNGARFIASFNPISRERQQAVQRREALKIEARLRKRLVRNCKPETRRPGIRDTGDSERPGEPARAAEEPGSL